MFIVPVLGVILVLLAGFQTRTEAKVVAAGCSGSVRATPVRSLIAVRPVRAILSRQPVRSRVSRMGQRIRSLRVVNRSSCSSSVATCGG